MRHVITTFSIVCTLIIAWSSSESCGQTGTFIDRQLATDLRVVSYNVFRDQIFPTVSTRQAAKFARVVNALDPDILNLQEVYNHNAEQVRFLLNTIAPLPNGSSWHIRKGGDNVIASKYPFHTINIPGGGEIVGLVDLPDDQFPSDFFFSNNHYTCCGVVGGPQDQSRQNQSDGIMRWIRDYRTVGGVFDLAPGTPFAIVGDLNIVGGLGPLNTLITGDIANEALYGNDFLPDWDDSYLTDAHPYHNGVLEEDYTWRDDNQIYDPGRLDYIIYSDSALDVGNKFILNTVAMTPEELDATGLQQFDIVQDDIPANFDHLPVVVDFRLFAFAESDFNYSRFVNGSDLTIWQENYGLTSGVSRAMGDANGDGRVDGRDFLIWQRQYTAAAATFVAVPEPNTLIIGLFAFTAVLPLSRKRRLAA